MSALETVLSQAQALGTSFVLRDGTRLIVEAPEPLPAALVAELRRHNPAVVAAFTASCGWCASPQLWVGESGRRYCLDCRAVFNPSRGRWAPGERDQRRLTRHPGRDAYSIDWL
jgi:hypothetical protein